jgi:hypothetical protein
MQPIKATCEGTRIEVHFASIQEFEVEFKKNIQAGGLLLAIDSPPPPLATITMNQSPHKTKRLPS